MMQQLLAVGHLACLGSRFLCTSHAGMLACACCAAAM